MAYLLLQWYILGRRGWQGNIGLSNKIAELISQNNNQNTHMLQQNTQKRENLSYLTPEEHLAVLEFAELLRKRFGSMVQGVILFGSKVNGKSNKYSDIDILIILSRLSWEIKKEISELAALENLKHNVLISTVRYDTETWENPAVKASPFARSVREKGIWI